MSTYRLEYIDHNHCEWNSMWEELGQQSINEGDPLCLHEGKCWEYLSSTHDHHYFRHELHPATNRPEHIYLERRSAVFTWAVSA